MHPESVAFVVRRFVCRRRDHSLLVWEWRNSQAIAPTMNSCQPSHRTLPSATPSHPLLVFSFLLLIPLAMFRIPRSYERFTYGSPEEAGKVSVLLWATL